MTLLERATSTVVGVGSGHPTREEPVAAYRKTTTPGAYIRHQKDCPAEHEDGPRCRCNPSYRGQRWSRAKQHPVWSPTFSARAEALTWLGAGRKGQPALNQAELAGPTFGRLADDWLKGVQDGTIGRRKGRAGVPYSDTTMAGYERSLRLVLIPEFGARPAGQIRPAEWQMFVDRLSREGLSRSRIANHLAVARAIYGWATRPTRRLVEVSPLLGVELPPADEVPRLRVADADEAALLLSVLPLADRVPYAVAFYAGLRRAEISRLDWEDVELDGYRLTVRKAKSDAGTGRRPPIAQQLRPLLMRAWLDQGRPTSGSVVRVSVMTAKLADRCSEVWEAQGLDRITLHECRHTYASFLMAAGYTLKELMEFLGHADLQMVTRYVKLLPQRDESDPAERLNTYLEARR